MPSTLYCARCLTTFTESQDSCPNLSCGGAMPKKGWGVLLGVGDLLDRNYKIIKPLAVGGAGLTYLAREVNAEGEAMPPDLAIKVLYTQRDAGPFLKRLSTEAQILQDLDHENIVQCRGFVQRTGHAPYLVTLFENGGSLAAHVEQLGGLSPTVSAGILRQVLLALDVAHQRGVVHRDLKPENVLLAEPVEAEETPHIRVADFGIAKVFGGVGQRLTRLGSFIGTPEYAAPEQFEGLAPEPATDLFAAGGLLYFLLTAQTPVKFSHRMDIENSYEELKAQLPPRLPVDRWKADEVAILQSVLDHVMLVAPGERWTIHQVLARLGVLLGDEMPEGGYRTVDITDPGAGPRVRQKAPPTSAFATPAPATPAVRPPVDPSDDEPEPVAAPARRGVAGMVAGFAGGLLALGALLVTGIVALGLGAWGFGWFDGPVTFGVLETPAVTVVAATPVDLAQTTDAGQVNLREQILRSLRDQGIPRVKQACRPGATLEVEVTVMPDGQITRAHVSGGDVPKSVSKCVNDTVEALTMPTWQGTGPIRLRALLAFQ